MQGKMKALVKHKHAFGAELQLVDIPRINEDEVLVEVKATSICGTDVHIYNWDAWAESRVKPPYIFGHEFSGKVVEVGAKVKHVEIGDHVSAETHFVCGKCSQCLAGKFHVCRHTKILGVDTAGCFAEYVAISEKNIWKNPKDMNFAEASLQEPLGNAVHTVLSSDITGQTVAVVGCGPIGIMAVAVAKAAGARQIIAFDLNDYRLGLAKTVGATTVVNSRLEDPLKITEQLTAGNGYDVVCEMSGHPKAVDQAFKIVTHGGNVAILSLPTAPLLLDITNDLVLKGVTVHGISGRQMFNTWQKVSGLIVSKQIDLLAMITHQLALEDYERGFEYMINGQCGKVVLTP